MQVTTDTRIQTMHFGPNGHLLRPRSAFTSKPLNTAQTVLEPIQQPVTIDIPVSVAQPPVPPSAPRRVLPLTRDYAPIVTGRDKKESRFLARSINERYSEYKSGRISLEALMTHITNYIIHSNNDWGIDSFLIDIQPSLENGTFHRSKLKFSTKLKKVWSAYRDATFPGSVRTPAPIRMSKRPATKANFEHAYLDYLEDRYLGTNEQAESELHLLVAKLARMHVKSRMFGVSPDFGDTFEDCAQLATVDSCEDLKTFRGSPAKAYWRVRNICSNKATDGFNQNNDIAMTRGDFFLTDESEDGDGEEYENPAIYKQRHDVGSSNSHVMPDPPQYRRPLPEFIQGTDLKICKYIRAGHDYANIGRILEISETAVELRVRKMRGKILKMKGDASVLNA